MSFNTLVTSRKPDELDAFCAVMCQVFAGQAKGNLAEPGQTRPFGPLGRAVSNLMAARL